MWRRKALDAQRRVGHEQPVLDRVVQTHHEGAEGVIDRLGREFAGLRRFCLVGDELADVVDGEIAQSLGGRNAGSSRLRPLIS